MRKVYLDHNATTPVSPIVLEAMLPYLKDIYGNPSSIHEFGRIARKAVEEARAEVASLINAKDAQEIVFTGSGTEADNFAIKGIAHALKNKGNHIITSCIEHHAVLNVCKFLEKEGTRVTYLPVDNNGIVDINELKKSITDKTILISIMLANNEVGTIEPIEEIASIAKEKGIILHTDAVQAAGKLPIDVQKIGVDLLSMSAHKIYGPKGIGALYIKKGIKITPLISGGHHERNRRAGTENVAGIAGFGKAAYLAEKELSRESPYLVGLRDYLHEGIKKKIQEIRLNGDPKKRLPNTLNISFKYLEGESIILNLDLEGVAVSTGSACTSGSLEPSHVLVAMGLDAVDAQGSVRFSLGHDNKKEDIDYVLEVLPPIIDRLRKMSPLYKEKK
ncbi:MAG: cysteine desulfurase NifS [Candidatus Omnitrophica bacterium CG07_land_8_20_14_0_80_42_15]|uniref:Cysteine desulfurase IscS n=1 Tax=Candidatus Aquitaenariimonas noxiae TaxID=1974741 RepID=A0A2J0L040_9BACT|nr:MAG: cysteine desulfurase NifS [Candidatus Omnitrophica bacterium CG07_land_8_20_14_0_80_42_15]